jgi:hypothetical protein
MQGSSSCWLLGLCVGISCRLLQVSRGFSFGSVAFFASVLSSSLVGFLGRKSEESEGMQVVKSRVDLVGFWD